jgi:hypothetical protein
MEAIDVESYLCLGLKEISGVGGKTSGSCALSVTLALIHTIR